MSPISLDDVRAAAEALRGSVVETPCVHSRVLSELTGAEVALKFENLQFTASFKERGALVKLLSLGAEERHAGVIAMSAGNHAQAVAYHAQRLGIFAVIVMPRFTPTNKVEHTRAFGAEVILAGESFDDAAELARRLAGERGLTLVHPYDDPRIIAGQGTVALEMLAAVPDLEVLLVPVGGGGLIAGNAVAAQGVRPDIEIIGVEMERFPALWSALRGVSPRFGLSTLAEGIAVKQPGRLTLPIIRERVREVLLVDEADIERAVLLLLEVEKTVTEGAGAAGLAALLRHRERFAGRRVGLILSGGNIDLPVLSLIIQRGLVLSGRLVRLRVALRDVPGALAEVIGIVGSSRANIVYIDHQRTFTELPLEQAEVLITLETRGHLHIQELLENLRGAGYAVELATHYSPAEQGAQGDA